MDMKSTKSEAMYLYFFTFMSIIGFPFQGTHLHLQNKYALNALNIKNNND